jgi:hypothetical protein
VNHLTETQLNEYLDQMLDESSRQQLDAHLAMCDQCRAKLNELEMLFSTLADLPDIPLTRDLAPGVLASLPKVTQTPTLWRQPAFIIQSLLTIILLAVSMPILRTLGQGVSAWGSEIVLPTMDFPSLSEIVAQLLTFFTWKPQFTFVMPEISLTMPSLPALPTIPFDPDANVLILLISAGILWVVGNFSLLRRRPEFQE